MSNVSNESGTRQNKLFSLSLNSFLNCKLLDQNEIYHYTTPIGLKSILDTKTFWFTNIKYLNDTSELSDVYNHFNSCCEELKMGKEIEFVNFINEISNIAFEKENFLIINAKNQEEYVPAEIFILSCCEDSDSLAMWNYYSKNKVYEGYNIGFCPNVFKSVNKLYLHNNLQISYVKVEYDTKIKRKALKDDIYNVYNIYKDNEATMDQAKDFIKYTINLKSLFYKSWHFRHEKECRIIITVPRKILIQKNIFSSPKINYEFREVNGIFTPYLSIPFEMNRDSYPSITIGPLLERGLAKSGLNSYLMTHKGSLMAANVKSSTIPIRY